MRTFLNGTRVETQAQWQARRAEMWGLLQQYYYGTFPSPEERPVLESSREINSTTSRGVTDAWFQVTFRAPGGSFTANVEMMWPDSPCKVSAPRPLFITQTNHRRWGLVAVARGYAAMITPTSDNDCAGGKSSCAEGDPTEPLAKLYPNATFQLIARRSYLTSLCIDFALASFKPSPGQESAPCLDAQAVGMTGHSRNGKQTLIAAALDQRIAAVMDSSSGVPAMSTYRYDSAPSFCETPTSSWPGPWWLPSVRGWAGQEDRLPVDSHFLLGLIAPRYVLAAVAWTEAPESAFNVEQSVKAGQDVYEWLGAPGRLRLDSRPGAHHGFESVQRYVDWADYAFGRLPPLFPAPEERWPRRGGFLHDFDLGAWLALNPRPAGLPLPIAPAPARIASMLGSPVGGGGVGWSPGGNYEPAAYIESMINRDIGHAPAVDRAFVDFGTYLRGTLLYPSGAEAGGKCLPGIVWLHPLSYQSGWVEAYLHADSSSAEGLATPDPASGFPGAVVLAFDQVGFGTRQHEGRDFYARQPTWSRLGRMIQDARSAVDVLLANQSEAAFRPSGAVDHLPQFPCVDRVFLAGYSVGGAVALHAAAEDARVAGVASVSGFEPLRSGAAVRRSGGNRRWFELHATQPQLAWFNGTETDIPYDFDDVIGLVKPRPALVYAPLQDRENDATLVRELVHSSQYEALELQQPDAINVMDGKAVAAVRDFIGRALQ